MRKTKIYVVIGTRAQLIKMAPLMGLMQKEGIEYDFIYTAQHRETIDQILQDFHVKEPDKTLYTKSEANTLRKFLGWYGYSIFHYDAIVELVWKEIFLNNYRLFKLVYHEHESIISGARFLES